MYTHSERKNCSKGHLSDLEDLKVLYPCNRFGCNENCLCDLKLKCFVKDLAFCTYNLINLPKCFAETKDISVDNLFMIL